MTFFTWPELTAGMVIGRRGGDRGGGAGQPGQHDERAGHRAGWLESEHANPSRATGSAPDGAAMTVGTQGDEQLPQPAATQ